MSTIKVTCIDQTMALTSTPVITSGGVHEDIVEFDFCPLWDGYTRTAVFWRTANDPHYRVLDETNTCTIPDEVLTTDGAFYFGVFGVNQEGVQRTTGVLKYNISPGVLRADTKPLEPTPDIYVQLLAGYAKLETVIRENAQTAEDAAAAAAAAQKAAEDAAGTVAGLLDDTLTSLLDDTMTEPGKAADAKATGDAIAALTAAIPGQIAAQVATRARVVVGTYVGAGSYGSDKKNTLTFDGRPLAVCINDPVDGDGTSDAYGGFVWVRGATYGKVTERVDVHLTWDDSRVSWYNSTGSGAAGQLNSRRTYYYMAILEEA
jgi:hypothetical protein